MLKETVTTPEEAAHAEAKVLLEAGPEFCGDRVDWKDMGTLQELEVVLEKAKNFLGEVKGGAGAGQRYGIRCLKMHGV